MDVGQVESRIRQEREQSSSELDARIPIAPDRESDRSIAIQEVIQQNRATCVQEGAWYEYVEGFGPQWHYESLRMYELERRTHELATTQNRLAFTQAFLAAVAIVLAILAFSLRGSDSTVVNNYAGVPSPSLSTGPTLTPTSVSGVATGSKINPQNERNRTP